MSEKLKPCPFCGREASIRRNLSTGYTAIQCDYCRAWWTPAELLTKNEIAEAWNRRAKDGDRIEAVSVLRRRGEITHI